MVINLRYRSSSGSSRDLSPRGTLRDATKERLRGPEGYQSLPPLSQLAPSRLAPNQKSISPHSRKERQIDCFRLLVGANRLGG